MNILLTNDDGYEAEGFSFARTEAAAILCDCAARNHAMIGGA